MYLRLIKPNVTFAVMYVICVRIYRSYINHSKYFYADCAGNYMERRRSTPEHCAIVGGGNIVAWRSKKLCVVSR